MKRPYITVKFAETLDGKIAAKDGSSRWISSILGRKFAHRLRAENDAVLVGIGTVLRDDPSLTVRLARGRNPIRVIVDASLRIPYSSKIVKEANRAKTIIFAAKKAPAQKIKKLQKKGIEVLILKKGKESALHMAEVISELYGKGVKKILVEGGKGVITSFLKERLADEIIAVISPKILGEGRESVGDLCISNIKKALKLKLKNAGRLGEDLIYRALIKK